MTSTAVQNQEPIVAQDWPTRLRQVHLRVTAPRLAILAALGENSSHGDAETIARQARTRLGRLSHQAVYDNLHALVGAGLIRAIEPAGHPTRYELRVGDNHHHIVCRGCGATHDVDCTVGAAPCLTPSADYGFAIDEAEVTFWGLCPSCQEPSETSAKAQRKTGWNRQPTYDKGR